MIEQSWRGCSSAGSFFCVRLVFFAKKSGHSTLNIAYYLEKLLTKRKEMESKELLKAFSESKKTLAEVLDFLREAETGEEQDNQ